MSPSPVMIRRRRRPPLDALDRAVLEVCGDWGSRPRARDFRAMLDRPEVAEEVQQLYAALGRSVRGGPVGLPRFKDELTAVWFDAGGFKHVFCGEPGPTVWAGCIIAAAISSSRSWGRPA